MFQDEDELYLISLFGGRIDLAIKDNARNEQELYHHLKNYPDSPYDSQLHPCFFVYKIDTPEFTPMHPASMQIFADSADDIPHLGSIEEYVADGAICGTAFISETNEFNDMSLTMDLDGDGTKGNVFIRVAHAYAYDPDTHEIVKELPIGREEEQYKLKKRDRGAGLFIR